jgi:hypothetical protein
MQPTNNDQAPETMKFPVSGRKSTFDEQTKRELVMAWEQRDKTQIITLADFLVKKLGVHPDGSPVISMDTFFGWRKKFKAK